MCMNVYIYIYIYIVVCVIPTSLLESLGSRGACWEDSSPRATTGWRWTGSRSAMILIAILTNSNKYYCYYYSYYYSYYYYYYYYYCIV